MDLDIAGSIEKSGILLQRLQSLVQCHLAARMLEKMHAQKFTLSHNLLTKIRLFLLNTFFLESKVVVLFYSAVDVSLLLIAVVVGSSCREKRHIR